MSIGDFELVARDGGARAGLLKTPHGVVETPVFMPVGTKASVKALLPSELRDLGAQIVLGNTYHLYFRPGAELIADLGGLHRFMAWDGPVLTDSGGFQVFSLRHTADRVDDEGSRSSRVYDGPRTRFTPELAMEVQRRLGSDIAMAFDECTARRRDARAAGGGCRAHQPVGAAQPRGRAGARQLVFGIVQGGTDLALRERSAAISWGSDLTATRSAGCRWARSARPPSTPSPRPPRSCRRTAALLHGHR